MGRHSEACAQDGSRKLCSLRIASVTLGVALLLSTGALGAEAIDLTDLDLEQLMKVRITSVSKREERLLRTPAAAFVITQEDIRRSGARDIPDLLRMVPGIQVARINSSEWAVSARWFNHRFANKLLVLVDGRTVYSPMVGGTFWEAHNIPLADIERIEVIRGPGGTVWGANAVNGVINIITKRAEETQGGLLTLGAGTQERAFGGFRYGGKLGVSAFYRVYV
jgi:iron complex outermembrane receptor protein